MRTRLHTPLAVAAAIAAALAVSPSLAAAAAPPGAAVSASATQVAGFLFVAGDVGRLSQVPSGTESLVLERVLQQLYTADPGLDPAQAVSDIQSLQQALSSGPQALSVGTLTVMAGNQRILAILRAL